MQDLFNKAISSPFCNTSYPLDKSNWEEYKIKEDISFKDEDKLCLYIHIPFCNRLCAFCEYVKFKRDNEDNEKRYMDILEKDINNFLETNNNFKLYGFDIGGGTPTSLNLDNFNKLMDIAKKINSLNKVEDYEPSIEATFETLTEDKLKLIVDAGFQRISLGVQTTNTKILTSQNRNVIIISKMLSAFKLMRDNGIKKINIDFMYGIFGQKLEDIKNVVKYLKTLNPEQVTLYEMRYNLIENKKIIPKEEILKQYKLIYDYLIKLGYEGAFGQNTFTKNRKDLGLSSYLRYRMVNNISYKGFGIAAQSKSKLGISYNIGKNHESIEKCFEKETFYADDIYLLPKEELVAKYIMISLYFGKFSLNEVRNILKEDPYKFYNKELSFLLENNYIEISNDIVNITNKGFEYYGAVGAMFYSDKVKKWLLGG